MPIFGLDASSANQDHKTGVQWYARHLIQQMKNQALAQGERVVLYSPQALRGGLSALPAGWSAPLLSWPLPFAWMQGRMSLEMLRRPPDLLFVPAQGLPRFLPKATVTTIHDLGFRLRPDLYSEKERRRLEFATADAVRRANHLLAVSQATKNDLVEQYRVDPAKVTVTPLAVDPGVWRSLPEHEVRPVLSNFNLFRPYFLFVGTLQAKKNVATLLRAFGQFQQAGGRHDLVLVGQPGHGYDAIDLAIRSLPDPLAVKLLGYQPCEIIAALLNAAAAFCFPSHFEGFGLPNLEAMACGAPLIASDLPVHHEVAGNAALFVPPTDVAGWAGALERLAANPNLRLELIDRGRERVRQFSWADTAARTWAVLRRLV
jgi:glycosyltransferase involved in cell wall biosynthesis